MNQLIAKNQTNLANSLTKQEMKKEVEILKQFEMGFNVEDIFSVKTNSIQKNVTEIGQVERTILIVAGSVYATVLLTYLLVFCWNQLTFPPEEYLTSEYDLLIHSS